MLSKVTQLGSGEARIQNARTGTVSFYLLLDLRYSPEHERQDLLFSATLGRAFDLSQLQLPHLQNEMYSTRSSLRFLMGLKNSRDLALKPNAPRPYTLTIRRAHRQSSFAI